MLSLFEQRYQLNEGTVIAHQARATKARASLIYETLRTYFGRSSYRLPNNHLLVQLLRHLQYAVDTPFENVVSAVNARALYVGKHFNFTSAASYGEPHKNQFFSSKHNDVIDYIVYVDEAQVSPFPVDNAWLDLPAVKVLHHPVTDYSLQVPNGEMNNNAKGFAVTSVDIPLLALQFRAYVKAEIAKGQEGADPNKFIVQHVLPRMYKSYMDLLAINQLLAQQGTIPATKPGASLPIGLPDISAEGVKAAEQLLQVLRKPNRSYSAMLRTMPVYFSPDGLKALLFPDMVNTVQSQWMIILARLPHINFLLEVAGDRGRTKNSDLLRAFQREIRTWTAGQIRRNIKDPGLEAYFVESLDRISQY